MKKIMYTGVIMLGALSLMACERTDRTGTTEREGTVVARDSVATEYEVTETIVEYDTTRETRTVKPDNDRDRDKDKNRR